MKATFLLLVLANAVFFLWEIREQRIQSSQAALRRVVTVGEPILLVAERPAADADESLSAATDLPVSAALADEDVRLTSPADTGFVGPLKPAQQTAASMVVASSSQRNGDSGQAEFNKPLATFPIHENEMSGPPTSQTVESDTDSPLETSDDVQPSEQIATEKAIVTQASKDVVDGSLPDSDPAVSIASGDNNALVTPDEELAVNELLETAVMPMAAENQQSPPQCRKFGPFDDEQVAEHWRVERLIPQGAAVSVVSEERETTTYFVYYPAAETFAQSLRNLAMLENRGIQDLWLFRSGPKKGIVSLGLFNRKTYATRYVSELATRGLVVEMGEIKKTKPAYFVKVITDELNFQQPPWDVGEVCTDG